MGDAGQPADVERMVVAFESGISHRPDVERHPQVVPVDLGRQLVVAEQLMPVRDVVPVLLAVVVHGHGLLADVAEIDRLRLVLPRVDRLALEGIQVAELRQDPALVVLEVEREAERADVELRKLQLGRHP